MVIVQLDTIVELGHHIVGQTVQGLYIAGIFGIVDAAITLKAGWELIATKWWTRITGHALTKN